MALEKLYTNGRRKPAIRVCWSYYGVGLIDD